MTHNTTFTSFFTGKGKEAARRLKQGWFPLLFIFNILLLGACSDENGFTDPEGDSDEKVNVLTIFNLYSPHP